MLIKYHIGLFALLCANTLLANKTNIYENMTLEELLNVKVYSVTKDLTIAQEAPANFTLLTKRTIEKSGYKKLIDLLRAQPGFYIIDDTNTYIIGMKGTSGSTFRFLLNDKPLFDARNNLLSLEYRSFFNIPLDLIEQIEITRSPQAVTYGPNSMYGSINIITKSFTKENVFSIGYGDNNQQQIQASYSKDNINGGYVINGGFYKTNGINGSLKPLMDNDAYNNLDDSANKDLDNLLNNEFNYLDASYRYKEFDVDLLFTHNTYDFYFPGSGQNLYNDGSKKEEINKQIAFTYKNDINKNVFGNSILTLAKFDVNSLSLPLKDENDLSYFQGYNKKIEFDTYFKYKYNNANNFYLGYRYKEIKTDLEYKYSFLGLDTYNIQIPKRKQNDVYLKYKYNANKMRINIGYRNTQVDNYNIIDSTESQPRNFKENSFDLPEFAFVYLPNWNNTYKLVYGKAVQVKSTDQSEYEEIENLDLIHNYQNDFIIMKNSLFMTQTNDIGVFVDSADLNGLVPDVKGKYKTYGYNFEINYFIAVGENTNLNFTLQDTKNVGDGTTVDLSSSLVPSFYAKYAYFKTFDKNRFGIYLNYMDKLQASIKDSTTGERYGKDSKDIFSADFVYDRKINAKESINLNITNLFNNENFVPATTTFVNLPNGMYMKQREVLLTYTYKF